MRRLGALLLAVCPAVGGCGAFAASTRRPTAELPAGAALLPARTRRLTNWELERSLAAFTGLDVTIAQELPPDVRQEGYTPNVAQDVSTAWATRYSALVQQLAVKAAARLPGRERCRDLGPDCRARRVVELGEFAFRRPLEAEEQRSLEALVSEAANAGEGFEGAMSELLQTLFESPSFIYVSELGEATAAGTRRLTNDELASELSFMLTGAPPDAELRAAAAQGALDEPAARAQQAWRLLGLSSTRYQFRHFALQWLEVDRLLDTAKSSQLFPTYDALKPYMLAETENYVDEVLVHRGASVQALLAGGFASVGPEMARFYGLKTYGPRASLAGSGRLGVLQQASFLAAHAHEDVTSPVKRGDFVMRKLLCEKVKRPAEIGLEVVMPPPSATLSNRARLSQHIADPGCASCHSTLDAIGFTFESFDAAGAAQTSDHGHAIDTRTQVRLGQQATEVQSLASSEALTRALLENPQIDKVSECFARHAFRYFSAQADPRVEETFVALRAELDESERDNLFRVLVAYVASDLFVLREVKGT
ncbi:MAG TPA: DUF1592 domain-containing protein [Polyangiaceae bacterium]|nr:DUF1592 domain-containing protein [Polyangiaceae bacterium]